MMAKRWRIQNLAMTGAPVHLLHALGSYRCSREQNGAGSQSPRVHPKDRFVATSNFSDGTVDITKELSPSRLGGSIGKLNGTVVNIGHFET
jgi:hypothetical protein